jgi:serine/threonine protein kinase
MADQAGSEAAGRVLGGKYLLLGPLGRGGMGTVHEAVQLDLFRRVAIKLIHDRYASDPVIVGRFRQEAQAAAAIGHPNIVQVIEFHAGATPYLVMERLEGKSFRELITGPTRMDSRRLAFIVAQVLSALGAAHAHGIVHRDVKPANIFVCTGTAWQDFVKVLDFGVAKLLESGAPLTAVGTIVGTLAYMPPEQARGESIDGRADIYAVGACMYHALTGKKPYEGDTVEQLYAMSTKSPQPIPELRPDVDPALIAVVERAMAKDLASRWQSAEQMREALAPWATPSLPAPAPDPPVDRSVTVLDSATPSMKSLPAPASLPRPREKWSLRLIAVSAAVPLFCCALAIVWAFQRAHESPPQLTSAVVDAIGSSAPVVKTPLFGPTWFAVGIVEAQGAPGFVTAAFGRAGEWHLVAYSGSTFAPLWASRPIRGPRNVTFAGKYLLAEDDAHVLYILDARDGTILGTRDQPAASESVTTSTDAPNSVCVHYRHDRTLLLALPSPAAQPAAAWCKPGTLPPQWMSVPDESADDNPFERDDRKRPPHSDHDVRFSKWSSRMALHEGIYGALVFRQGKGFGAAGFDPSTFTERWNMLFSAETVAATPVAIGQNCFYVRHGEWESRPILSCLDLKTGTERWSYDLRTSFVLDARGPRVFVASGATLDVLDSDTGSSVATVAGPIASIAEAK